MCCMIIACPACQSKFNVDENDILVGRKVRCSLCHHIWFQTIEGQEEIESQGEQAVVSDDSVDMPTDFDENTEQTDSVNGEAEQGDIDTFSDGNDALSQSIPPNLSPADDDYYNPKEDNLDVLPEEEMMAIHKTEHVETSSRSAVLLGSLFVAFCLLGATVAYAVGLKHSAMSIWPQVAGVYNLFGIQIPYPGQGLEINNFMAKRIVAHGDELLYVRGRVDNLTDEALYIPAMKIQMAEAGEELRDWVTPYENYKIDGGESVPFEYGLPQPPAQGDTVNVTFIEQAVDTSE